MQCVNLASSISLNSLGNCKNTLRRHVTGYYRAVRNSPLLMYSWYYTETHSLQTWKFKYYMLCDNGFLLPLGLLQTWTADLYWSKAKCRLTTRVKCLKKRNYTTVGYWVWFGCVYLKWDFHWWATFIPSYRIGGIFRGDKFSRISRFKKKREIKNLRNFVGVSNKRRGTRWLYLSM